jgi:hypothetical protein
MRINLEVDEASQKYHSSGRLQISRATWSISGIGDGYPVSSRLFHAGLAEKRIHGHCIHLQGFINVYGTSVYKYRVLGSHLLLEIYLLFDQSLHRPPFSNAG